MITNAKRKLRLSVDKRGYITTGTKTEKGFPKSLDYFDVSGFPEVVTHYGEQPSSLVVMPPANEIETFYNDEFATWGKKGGDPVKKRQCDGETCLHRVGETVGGVEYGRGELSPCVCDALPEESKDRCQYGAILKAYIVTPDGAELISPVLYGFRTGSPNSGDSMYSELQRLDFLLRASNGGVPSLAGRPLLLSVRMVTGSEEKPTRFPIWNLSAFSFRTPSLPEAAHQGRMIEATAPETTDDAEIIDELQDLGEQVFGTEWPQKLREIVEKATGGAETNPDALPPTERKKTIDWLRQKAAA